ncbi:hypothetical protein CC86DRAFT_402769 [Ophiobolus disseminans]|uniref:Uncharacterized protein n=1 Tax=Ophiobolus disseminans TaxID=1469910 RepID=A0A6A7ABR7_9PLEO|nr:hypothetical protein CC86DRAFT_402769 [Ophiobolus disseminans]
MAAFIFILTCWIFLSEFLLLAQADLIGFINVRIEPAFQNPALEFVAVIKTIVLLLVRMASETVQHAIEEASSITQGQEVVEAEQTDDGNMLNGFVVLSEPSHDNVDHETNVEAEPEAVPEPAVDVTSDDLPEQDAASSDCEITTEPVVESEPATEETSNAQDAQDAGHSNSANDEGPSTPNTSSNPECGFVMMLVSVSTGELDIATNTFKAVPSVEIRSNSTERDTTRRPVVLRTEVTVPSTPSVPRQSTALAVQDHGVAPHIPPINTNLKAKEFWNSLQAIDRAYYEKQIRWYSFILSKYRLYKIVWDGLQEQYPWNAQIAAKYATWACAFEDFKPAERFLKQSTDYITKNIVPEIKDFIDWDRQQDLRKAERVAIMRVALRDAERERRGFRLPFDKPKSIVKAEKQADLEAIEEYKQTHPRPQPGAQVILIVDEEDFSVGNLTRVGIHEAWEPRMQLPALEVMIEHNVTDILNGRIFPLELMNDWHFETDAFTRGMIAFALAQHCSGGRPRRTSAQELRSLRDQLSNPYKNSIDELPAVGMTHDTIMALFAATHMDNIDSCVCNTPTCQSCHPTAPAHTIKHVRELWKIEDEEIAARMPIDWRATDDMRGTKNERPVPDGDTWTSYVEPRKRHKSNSIVPYHYKNDTPGYSPGISPRLMWLLDWSKIRLPLHWDYLNYIMSDTPWVSNYQAPYIEAVADYEEDESVVMQDEDAVLFVFAVESASASESESTESTAWVPDTIFLSWSASVRTPLPLLPDISVSSTSCEISTPFALMWTTYVAPPLPDLSPASTSCEKFTTVSLMWTDYTAPPLPTLTSASAASYSTPKGWEWTATAAERTGDDVLKNTEQKEAKDSVSMTEKKNDKASVSTTDKKRDRPDDASNNVYPAKRQRTGGYGFTTIKKRKANTAGVGKSPEGFERGMKRRRFD